MEFPAILSALQPFQICIFNRKYKKLTLSNGSQLMGKRFMANLHDHWTVHAKVEFQNFPPDVRYWGCPFHNLWSWTENIRFTLISFMGFPAILSALQPFQICIFNRKYRKLTFSSSPQLMGKRFMANLHASLDNTYKSRISKLSTRCQILGAPFHNLWSWPRECTQNFLIWGVYSTTFDPEQKM